MLATASTEALTLSSSVSAVSPGSWSAAWVRTSRLVSRVSIVASRRVVESLSPPASGPGSVSTTSLAVAS